MNKRLLGIFVFLYCIFYVDSCRCTRDFEDKNVCCRSNVWIEIKSVDEEKSVKILSTDPSGSIISSTNKTTLYVDLNHNLDTEPELYDNDYSVYTLKIVAKVEKMPDVEVFIRYTKRYKLISPNLGGIEQYKILSVECRDMKKKIEGKNGWLSSLDREPDVQIFL